LVDADFFGRFLFSIDAWGFWLLSTAQAVCQMAKELPPQGAQRLVWTLLILLHTLTLCLDVVPMITYVPSAYTIKIGFVLGVILIAELSTVFSYRSLSSWFFRYRLSHAALNPSTQSNATANSNNNNNNHMNGGGDGSSAASSNNGYVVIRTPTASSAHHMMSTTSSAATTNTFSSDNRPACITSATSSSSGAEGIRRALRRIKIIAMSGFAVLILFVIVMVLIVVLSAQRHRSVAIALLVILVWSAGVVGLGLVSWQPLRLSSTRRHVVYAIRPTATGLTSSKPVGGHSHTPIDDNNSGVGSGLSSSGRGRALLSPGRAAATADLDLPLPGTIRPTAASSWRDEARQQIHRRLD
jgi:hypothetical protein